MKSKIKILFFITILTSLSFSVINTLFTPIVMRKQINESLLSVILTSYSVFVILMTPFFSKVAEKFNRRNLFLISLLFQTIITLFYGIIPYIDNTFFANFMISLRCFHGISSSLNINLLISTAALLSKEKDLTFNFAMIDLGWMIGKFFGPTITSLLFSIGGVTFTFTFCSSFLLASFYYALKINFKRSNYKESDHFVFKEDFFSNLIKMDIFILFLCQILNVLTKTFFGPIILNHIQNKFSISLANASRLICLSYISYFFTTCYISRIIERLGSKRCIAIGVLLNLIGLKLINPIGIFPQVSILTAIGFFILGLPSALIDIPIFYELISLLKDSFQYSENSAIDITASIYSFANCMGEIIGPVYGSFTANYYNFEFSCLLIALINFIFLVLFAFIYRRYFAFGKITEDINSEKNKCYNEKIEKLSTILWKKNTNYDELNINADLKEKLI